MEFVKNNVTHTVRREGTTGRVWLRVGDQPEQETSEEVIQSFANIQGYSQKQLSHVSVRNKELLRLLRNPIANELATIEMHRKDTAGTLRQAFGSDESRLKQIIKVASGGSSEEH